MNELIQAWTRAANAVAAYYEQEALNPIKAAQRIAAPADERAAAVYAELKKERKPRASKAEPAAPAAPFDPMMDTGGSAAVDTRAEVKAGQATAPVAMTEAESTAAAQDANKRLVKAFPTISTADKMPEGFHKAKALLAEFGVARTTDLVHAQRVQYITKIDALIAAKGA
jgi:hypothetical protein